MKLSNDIIEMILGSEGKALATSTPEDINVVAVSTVKVIDGKIILVNYFMGKTLENIQRNPKVALACWKGLAGYQIKGTAEHIQSGELFDSVKAWVKEILPERIVLGLIIISPEEVFDISASTERAGQKM